MPTLDWIGKDKVINHHKDVPYKVLERKYSFDESGMHKEDIHSNNMIIHGDNLEALKSLLPQYEGKIKCIYIDPPYNTGNEGWIYNDNVNDPKIRKWLGEVVGKEGEDLSRHDKWLCMMYPRLVLLQKLLADDGAIFISIDDNEQAFLKCVCDEIFGARNFVAQLVWQRTFATKNDAKYFSSEHEYVLVYAAEIEKLKIKALPKSEKQLERYKNPDNDPRGPWISTDLLRMEHRDNSVYEVPTPQGKLYKPQPGTSWRHPKEEMMALIKNNEVWFGANGNSKPRRKKFLADVKSGIIPQTIWKHVDVGHTQEAKQQLKKILDASTDFFATPKPVRLINQILRIICDDGDIVLDSFAGSATTAHAVMQSDLKLSYIMIEVEDYADTITAERVKRVIDGYGEGKNAVDGTGGNFSYYELGSPLFLQDGTINNDIDTAEIRKYIWYTETNGLEYTENKQEKYYIGSHNDTAYYFYYEKDKATILDYSFLATVNVKNQAYIIYADSCALSDIDLQKWNITFKKIPRDRTREIVGERLVKIAQGERDFRF